MIAQPALQGRVARWEWATMLFIRPLLAKSTRLALPTVWKLVMKRDYRTGKILIFSQRFHVSPEEAKTPQFRQLPESEAESYKELLQRIGEGASAFIDSLDERWQRAEGESELKALFAERKFIYRGAFGRVELTNELPYLYDEEHCEGVDKETSRQVMEMARQVKIDDTRDLRAWLEKAVELKHRRIREVIGAGDAGWIAVPIPPLPQQTEAEGETFVRSDEHSDPRSKETVKFERVWHDALASAFSKALMRYLFQPLLAKARENTLNSPAVANFLGEKQLPYIWLEPLPAPDDLLRRWLYRALQVPTEFPALREVYTFVGVPDLIDGIPGMVEDPLSKKAVPYEAVLERWLKDATKETAQRLREWLKTLQGGLFCPTSLTLLSDATLDGGVRRELLHSFCAALETESGVWLRRKKLSKKEENRLRQTLEVWAEREWKEKLPQLASDDELLRAVKEFAIIACNAARERRCADPTYAVGRVVGEAMTGIRYILDRHAHAWLRDAAYECLEVVEEMTTYLRELARRMGYNLKSEEGRKRFGELLSKIAKVKTDTCGVYEVPPPLMALKAVIAYYQVLPAIAYGLDALADFAYRTHTEGRGVPAPDTKELGLTADEDEVENAVAKWAEATPGLVTQVHKEVFARYRKEAGASQRVAKVAKMPDVAVIATTPSAFFGLGDDATCFSRGGSNFHHKYYLALLDNSFVLYFLSEGRRRGRMWGRMVEKGDGYTFYFTNVYGVGRPHAQQAAGQILQSLFPHWEVGTPTPVGLEHMSSICPQVYTNPDSFYIEVRPRAGR